MNREDRKTAIGAYKERKVEAGVYAVRCSATAQTWVGCAPDLSTIRNRLWFTLRQHGNLHRSLQEAWNRHGSEAFSFEVVDRLAEEEIGYSRQRTLQDLAREWSERLEAVRI